MTGPFSELQQPDFQAGLQRLLPRGRAWSRDPASNMAAFLNGHADATFVVHQNFVNLLEVESFPATAVELLEDFEADYGLPDPCTPLGATLQQRRAALLYKIATIGGQSIAYYIAAAAILGIAITITELRPFETGVNTTGQVLNPLSAAWTWIVNAPSIHVISFIAGLSATGENLRTTDNTSLACRLKAIAPAHTVLLFNYD